MKERYFKAGEDRSIIVRHKLGCTEYYDRERGWVESTTWFSQLFFNDYTDFDEISVAEAQRRLAGVPL